MVPLSAVIITYNEERNIRPCLESLKGVVDEVIVVDSFSTDRTEAICKELGATFISHAWPGYGAQKNYGNELASSQWILSIDADEVLSEPLKKAILAFRENPFADACSMNRLTSYCGNWIRHCGWYPDRKIRVFNKAKASWNLEKVHEELIFQPGVKTGHLEGDLLHYSYHTREDHLKQIENYSSLAARQYFEKGKKVGWLKLWVSGPVRFVRDYLLKLGFLDGYPGLLVCWYSARTTRLKYQKLRSLYQKQ